MYINPINNKRSCPRFKKKTTHTEIYIYMHTFICIHPCKVTINKTRTYCWTKPNVISQYVFNFNP